MSDDPKSNREEKAVDALITGALHSWRPKEVSDTEVNEFLASKVELTDSEKSALSRVHEQFRSGDSVNDVPTDSVLRETMESPYMAMNRENAKDQAPAETREEVDRKRAELLAKLKAKRRPTG